MMLVGSALKGFAVETDDGRIGTASDFLFDDRTWKIRWMVVDTGRWLPGRKILVHPSAIAQPDYLREEIPVRLSQRQVKDSPEIHADSPLSQQMERSLFNHYGWDPLWGGGHYFGSSPYGMDAAFQTSPYRGGNDLLDAERRMAPPDAGDRHLRSLTTIIGYQIQAQDGPIGHVENFLVDDATWGIRYLVIDTRNWWPGRHVLMSPYAVGAISWSEQDVTLRVTRDQVKGSPAWDPADIINRNYETSLHKHYGWPAYGS